MKLVLVGFMGTGKTAVGAVLARRLGVPLVDTDRLIEVEARMTIPEIFAREGEEGFRRREREAVSRAASLEKVVLAVGGGAWIDARNRELLRREARVVCLWASPEEIVRRLRRKGDRPLLKVPDVRSAVEELLARREPFYRLADQHVNTSDRTPEEVADIILGKRPLARSSARGCDRLMVKASRPYPVIVGSGVWEALPSLLREAGLPEGRVCLAADHVVDLLYGDGVAGILVEAGYEVLRYRFPAGERSKGMAGLQEAYDHILAAEPERTLPILALGGGVTGDLMGFVAATLLRGVPYVQLPTTLLAQVDSSVGGKVAINHRRGKNLIGAFYQPRLVAAEVTSLLTLPEVEFQSGMGEVVKHALLAGGSYLEFLLASAERIAARDPEALREVVAGSCRIKASYVARDEREAGVRAFLNLGHTSAHAVEAASGGEVPHGIAVGYGLSVAARISLVGGYLSREEYRFIGDLLESWGFPTSLTELPRSLTPQEILRYMRSDKKRRQGKVRWVLLKGIGRPFLADDVDDDTVLRALGGELG